MPQTFSTWSQVHRRLKLWLHVIIQWSPFLNWNVLPRVLLLTTCTGYTNRPTLPTWCPWLPVLGHTSQNSGVTIIKILKVPSGQIESAWEWYHWIGLKKSSSAIGFWFLIWVMNFLKKLWSCNPLHSKMNSTSCLFGSRFVWAQTATFSAESCSKNARKSTFVLWITTRE